MANECGRHRSYELSHSADKLQEKFRPVFIGRQQASVGPRRPCRSRPSGVCEKAIVLPVQLSGAVEDVFSDLVLYQKEIPDVLDLNLFAVLPGNHQSEAMESDGSRDGCGKHHGAGRVEKLRTEGCDEVILFSIYNGDADDWWTVIPRHTGLPCRSDAGHPEAENDFRRRRRPQAGGPGRSDRLATVDTKR